MSKETIVTLAIIIVFGIIGMIADPPKFLLPHEVKIEGSP